MRPDACTCPKCLEGQLPLIQVEELPVPDMYFPAFWFDAIRNRARRRSSEIVARFKVSPPARKAANPAAGVGVFCNGSTAPNKGRLAKGVKS